MADAEFADAGRVSLLDKVFTLLTRDSPLLEGTLPVFTWAFLWLCDLRNLREIVDSLSSSADSERVEMLKRVLTNPYALREEVLKPWILKSRRGTESYPTTPLGETPPRPSKKRKIDSSTPQTPTGSSHHPTASSPIMSSPIIPRPSRDPTLADSALQRDKACVVKGTPDKAVLKAAHIYPFSMTSDLDKDRERLWSYLRIFWPADQVNDWKATLLTPAKTEILENVITMSSDVHDAWDACRFALKPIKLSQDRKKLEIQFFWLEQGIFKSEAALKKSIFLTKPQFPSTLQESSRGLRFYHNFTGARIHSGFNFDLKTHDPDNFPLPSFELLNMQWHLTRLAAMMGGAEFRDELLDDSSDGPDDWPMLASSSEESAIFSSGQLKRRWDETDDESVSDESVHGKLDDVVRESDATVEEAI